MGIGVVAGQNKPDRHGHDAQGWPDQAADVHGDHDAALPYARRIVAAMMKMALDASAMLRM
jgi:hypothetical protein